MLPVVLRRWWIVAMGLGCSAQDPEAAGASSQPILGGAPAADLTGVVHVAHPDSPIVCSGTVIAPSLVVTAKHCVIRETSGADAPLRPEAFSVGFGPDIDHLITRAVDETVSWRAWLPRAKPASASSPAMAPAVYPPQK
jgi:hypothetical protein